MWRLRSSTESIPYHYAALFLAFFEYLQSREILLKWIMDMGVVFCEENEEQFAVVTPLQFYGLFIRERNEFALQDSTVDMRNFLIGWLHVLFYWDKGFSFPFLHSH
ncbi:hypothetical protein Nepgr_002238 [Nepenthes gracilis]|uniref:Uncharacterized protein n=1 Tax=Nepenthes gracilis TaxID=150966 RepID=A0AAD3P9F3_NEPGR|nr:hypothetical protein Nepgr_002238 [Nepenthes gracilis]